MKAINSYEDRLKNPNLDLINFEYLITHPEVKGEVVHKYMTDFAFREQIFIKLQIDPVFKSRFYDAFKNYSIVKTR